MRMWVVRIIQSGGCSGIWEDRSLIQFFHTVIT